MPPLQRSSRLSRSVSVKRKKQVIELRDYQRESLDEIYAWFEAHEGNPCSVMPTGGGKSVVLAQFCKEQLEQYPKMRIYMLAPTRELVAQNYAKLRQIWPNAPVGVFSAALGRRELYEPITIGNIHSLHDKTSLIPAIDVLLIDEAHLVPNADTGMYRKFFAELKIKNPDLVVIGFTATPYRLGQGDLTEGEDALFDDLIETITTGELIRRGWLSKLKSKATELRPDISGVRKRGGDFIDSELQKKVDTKDNNTRMAREVYAIAEAHERQAILVFCAGIDHANHMRDALNDIGIPTAVVTGKTPKAERDRIFEAFRNRDYMALCNVAIATTGFDYPDIDFIVMARATMSRTLYEQMAGRGLRLKSHTDYCIVADFAGNVERHGPITQYDDPTPAKKKGGVAPTKECPGCKEIVFAGFRKCPECGHVFPAPVKVKDARLRDDDIMGKALAPPSVMKVRSWRWWKHTSKRTKKDMLAVRYTGTALGVDVTEYWAVAHEGQAGDIAIARLRKMVRDAGAKDLPDCDTLEEAAAWLTALRPPSEIEYRMEGRFPRMLKRTFGEMSAAEELPPSDFDDVIPYDPAAPIAAAPKGGQGSDWYDDDIPF